MIYCTSFSSDGPFDDNVQVSPVQFVTNWSQSFKLTCLVTEVYPLPSYVWNDVTCDNGNKGSTCTFTPHSPTEMTEATCIVKRQKIDGFGNKLASKLVQLNFKCKYKFLFCLPGSSLWGVFSSNMHPSITMYIHSLIHTSLHHTYVA